MPSRLQEGVRYRITYVRYDLTLRRYKEQPTVNARLDTIDAEDHVYYWTLDNGEELAMSTDHLQRAVECQPS